MLAVICFPLSISADFFSAGGTLTLLKRCDALGSLEGQVARMLVPLSVTRLPPALKETLGFASPPRDGFAFVEGPGSWAQICCCAPYRQLREIQKPLRHVSPGMDVRPGPALGRGVAETGGIWA